MNATINFIIDKLFTILHVIKFLRQSLRPNLCDPLKSIKMVEKSCLVLWKFVVNQERDIDGNPVLRLGCGARELREIRNS